MQTAVRSGKSVLTGTRRNENRPFRSSFPHKTTESQSQVWIEPKKCSSGLSNETLSISK